MKHIQPVLFLWLLFLSSACGSAEAVKSYNYPTTKYNLEKAVVKVIRSNPHIVIDTSESRVIVRRNPGDKDDTTTKVIRLSEFHGHSEDSAAMAERDKAVIRIKITLGEADNHYTFRYLGDEQYWESSKSSAIFIQNITDKYGNSVSQGHNEKGQFNSKLTKEFIALFESEVVRKIDQELKLKHTVD